MSFVKRSLRFTGIAALLVALLAPGLGVAAERQSFRLAWTIYAGWMPWKYAQESGIMKKWADKYGIDVEITQINDYIESINQFTAGQYDAVTLTSMDALSIPAASGVDSTALIIGDYSNGNDGIVMKHPDGGIKSLNRLLKNPLRAQAFRLARNPGAVLKMCVHPSKNCNDEYGPA
ncbi:type 2 periplasmic-binding domain-containing protein [Alloalcanivorax mobilis]|uniref:hypothetical protein n=1 Tax=Alloalcanivorax mobilis TaxID=2019569 RepID=UPI0018E4299C